MPTCTVKIGNIVKDLKIQRPSYKFFKEKYEEITNISSNESLQKKLYEAIYKQAMIYTKNNKVESEGISKELTDKVMISPEKSKIYERYALVGGQPLEEYVRFIMDRYYKGQWRKNPNEPYPDYSNTCALRVSYAFNYGGMPIKNLCQLPSNALIGEDKHKYYTGVQKIKELLLNNWKAVKPYSSSNNKDFYKAFYNTRVEPFSTLIDEHRRILNIARVTQIRKENKDFFDTLKSLNQNGVVIMTIDGWDNAGGHTTFWDKDTNDFLDKTNYLGDNRSDILVRELCFWKI